MTELKIEKLTIGMLNNWKFQIDICYTIPCPRIPGEHGISRPSDPDWQYDASSTLQIQLGTLPATTMGQWTEWLRSWLLEQAQSFQALPEAEQN
ncbi:MULTISPECIES: hypothetical protein [Asaia]|nr:MULTISPECIES: hypothetical protein [Asaia]ETD00082.1 hypothetical protein P792_00550 [Asaia sp. SF2.1]